MRFTLDDAQVPDGTILVFGIRYVDVDNPTGPGASRSKVFKYVPLKAGVGIRYVDADDLDGPGASRSKVFEYVALKARGRWYLTGTGRVPQDAGWGAVARWLDDPRREVVSVDLATGRIRLYPEPNPPS